MLGEVDAQGQGLSLDLLADYPGEISPDAGDHLDEASNYLADARRLQADPGLAERAYGRAVEDGTWLWPQYFFWEYYNPKHLLGFGRHEGDWELIQIGLDAERVPQVVTYAQHNGGAGRSWADIEHHPDAGGPHPVVFVAPFSHASYFEARTHWHPGGPDTPDGKGPAYLPQIEPFGAWGTWPGRWGNSTGVLPRISGGRLGGRSPASPGAQTERWKRPTTFHRKAQAKRPFAAVDRALWWVGRWTYPRPPKLAATLEGVNLRGEFTVETSLLRRPTQVYLTAHDPDQDGEPILRGTAASVSRGRGTFELILPRAPARCRVRASAFNWLRQRSEPAEPVTVAQP